MQRNISYKNPVTLLVYIGLYILYSALGSIYPLLPPLLAVLFVLFIKALDKKDMVSLVLVSLCLIIFEVNYGYILFSTIFYFYIIHKFILPKIQQNFNCYACVRILYVLLAYIGYFFFLLLVSKIFLLPEPNINYYIVYYIVIEFFLVSLL